MQLLVFLGALLASAVITRLVRNFANKRGWISAPSSDRHIHTRQVPRLGGVAIFLTLWCVVGLGGRAFYGERIRLLAFDSQDSWSGNHHLFGWSD